MRLELTRRHHILGLWMLIRIVPLRHLLGIWRRVRSSIVLRVVVDIGIVMHGRVCLGRDVIILVVTLPPSLMERHGGWNVRAWHHCRQASSEPSQ